MIIDIKKQLKTYKIFYDLYNMSLGVVVNLKRGILPILYNIIPNNCNIPNYNHSMHILYKLRPNIPKKILASKLPESVMDLSIIVPIYNVEHYLSECLSSLKNQITNYVYEVICIDDGSSDRSGAILDEYMRDDHFVIIHQENRGHSGARNRGIEVSRGKYITFVDSDDYIASNFVEKTVALTRKKQYDIILCPYAKCNADSRLLATYKYQVGEYDSFMDYIQFDGTPWGKVYARKLWEDVRFPENMVFEDTIIFNIIYRMSKSIYAIDETMYYYRIHGDNTIDRIKNSVKVLDAVYSVKYCLDVASSLLVDYSIDYYAFLLLQCGTHIWYRIKKLDENVQQSIFSLLCTWVTDYKEKMGKKVYFNDTVLRCFDISFSKKNFRLWKVCSKIYPSNFINIKKGFKVS